ncbi:MAG: hypothetical protein IPI12_06715 [Ignavibacteriales bacterium]|nr:hypothetical protein [Ignavibacteriales bacterium]
MFSALLMLFLNVPGYSTIRYVKAGNPTPVAPYTTWATASDSIQKVVDICLSGDTILIGTGVYTALVVSNSVGRYLTIAGVDVDSCIIDISGYSSGIPPNPINTRAFNLKDHTTIRNLTFKTHLGSPTHLGLVLVDNFNSTTECSISNLKFIGGFSIALATGKVTGEIEDCYFYNVQRAVQVNFGHGMDPVILRNNLVQRCNNAILTDFAVVKNNWFLSIMNNGLDLGTLFYSTRNYVYNNLISALEPGHIGVFQNQYGEVINNVITGFNYGMEPKSNCTIKNNVIMNSRLAAIGISEWPTLNGDINFNLFYNNKMITGNSTSFDPDTTVFYTSDPMFENQDSNNYLLQMFSPLIDAGDPNILDVDGSRSDVGLYGGPYGQSYSYQDLAPKRPKFTLVSKQNGKVNFNWRGGTEADFNSFSLYRSRDPQFIPSDNNRIYSGIDTLFTDSLTDPTGSYSYKLTAKDNQGNVSKLDSVTVVITGVSAEEENPTHERIYLYQNYPNPFNPSTKIKFSLKEDAEVILRVYDVNGELVTMLQNGWLPAGEYEREFSPATIGTLKDIASGVYFYNLLVRDKNLIPLFVKTEKMMFLQ